MQVFRSHNIIVVRSGIFDFNRSQLSQVNQVLIMNRTLSIVKKVYIFSKKTSTVLLLQPSPRNGIFCLSTWCVCVIMQFVKLECFMLKVIPLLALICKQGKVTCTVCRRMYQFLLFTLQPYIKEICDSLRGDVFDRFIERLVRIPQSSM